SVQIGLTEADLARRVDWSDLARVRAALHPTQTLVEICGIRRCQLEDGIFDFPLKEHRYIACVIPPAEAGEVGLVDLGPADAIEASLTAARQLFQQQPANRDSQSEHDVREALVALRKLVFDPLR